MPARREGSRLTHLLARLQPPERHDWAPAIWRSGSTSLLTGTIVERPLWTVGSHVEQYDHLYSIVADDVLGAVTAPCSGFIRWLWPFAFKEVEVGRVVALVE